MVRQYFKLIGGKDGIVDFYLPLISWHSAGDIVGTRLIHLLTNTNAICSFDIWFSFPVKFK